MPQDEPSGVGPEVQKAIKQAFPNLSANLTTVIESRLSDIKRDLVEERDSSVASVVKRGKRSEVEFKSKGNKKQFEHQQQVLDCLTEVRKSKESYRRRYKPDKKAY